jgi:hypothetical protein
MTAKDSYANILVARLVIDLDRAAIRRNGALALGFEVPMLVWIPNGPETTDSCSQRRVWEGTAQ